jgi:hypothetical protein
MAQRQIGGGEASLTGPPMGTERLRDAAGGLAAADERVAAREGWVKCVERGH